MKKQNNSRNQLLSSTLKYVFCKKINVIKMTVLKTVRIFLIWKRTIAVWKTVTKIALQKKSKNLYGSRAKRALVAANQPVTAKLWSLHEEHAYYSCFYDVLLTILTVFTYYCLSTDRYADHTFNTRYYIFNLYYIISILYRITCYDFKLENGNCIFFVVMK